MSNNLERAKALAKAIRQHETGNKQIKGASGELSSRYQFMPSTWKSYAKEILGNANAPLTLENENKVATLKIKKWLDNGWSNEQVAAAWNGGEGSIKNDKWKSLVGVNSAGVKYDTPSYVKNVMKNFETFSKEMKPTTSFSQNIDIKRQRGLTDTDILNDLFAKNPSKRKEINDIRSKTNDRDALNQLSMKIAGVMPSVPSVPTAEQKQQIEKEQKQQTIKDTIKKTQDVLGGAVSTMRRPEMYKEQFEEASKKIQGFPEQGEESRNEYYKRLEQQGFDPKLVEEKRKAAIKYGTQEQNKGIIKSVVSAPLDALQFFLTPTLDVAKNIAGIFGKQVPGTEEIRAGIDKTTSVFSPTNPDQELGFSTGRIAMITLAPEITQTKTTTSKAGQFMRQKKAAFNKSYKPTTYTHSTQQTPKQEPKKAYTYTPSKEAKKTADALTVNLTKGSTKINVKDFNKSATSVVSTMDNGTKKSIATSKDPVYIINNYVETKNKAMTTAAYDVTKQLDGKVKIDGEVITNNVEKNLLKNTQYRDLLEDAKKGNEQALKTLNEIIKELEFIRTNKFDPSNILDKVINGNKSFGRYYDNPELQFSSLHKAVDKAITDVYRKELYSIIDPLTDGKFSQMRKLHSDFITFGKQLNKKYQINERARIDAQEKNPFKGFKVGITDPILHPFKTVSQIGNVIENTKKRTPFERDIQEAFKKYKDLPVEDISNVQITNLPKQQYPTMLNTGTGRTEVNQPIITPAPTTYEKPAAKIGNEDFKRIEKFIQDQEALKVFKVNQNKAYEIAKSKFDTIKENYPALVETIESHPLHDIINKQSKSGEFAGKLSDKASNLDNLLMERGYDDVEQGREAFEGLKELIYRRQRMEKEMSDLYGNLKEIKAGNKTIIDDYVNPKSTEIEDIDFGTIDTSIQPNIQPEKPKYKSMLEALNDPEFNRKQTGAINKTNRSNVTKRSNNLYHTTPISNLDSISKKGLTTGNKAKFEGVSSSDNISFSANEVGAKYYAGDNEIIIRTKTGFKPKDLESDLLAGGEGAYITKTNIPPEMLEIKDGRKWIPIKEYTNKKSIKPVGTPQPSSTSSELIKEARKYDSAEEFAQSQWNKLKEYKDGHVAPGFDNTPTKEKLDYSGDFSLDEVSKGFSNQPDDYFDPKVGARYYMYDNNTGKESYNALKPILDGKKDDIIAYRTVPKNIEQKELLDGDWVTFSKQYAIDHGEHRFGDGKYKIIEQKTNKKDLWWDGNDINEWGYDTGKTWKKFEDIYNQAKKTK